MLVGTLGVALAGCRTARGNAGERERCAADSAAPSFPPIPRDTISPERAATPDAREAAISRRVPGGYAGHYIDRGRIVVRLVDPAQRAAALAALGPLLKMDLSRAEVRPARWDFSQLYEWYRYLNDRLEGVRSGEIDKVRNRISYYALWETDRPKVEQQLAALRVPCGLVYVGFLAWRPSP